MRTRITLGRVRVRTGRNASISGRVRKSGLQALSGHVRVAWQQKRGTTWKMIHGGQKQARKPFTFTQKLKRNGQWRVRVTYVNVGPYKSSTSTSKPFHVGG